jgi:proteasome lid subunit RPN8/RPN11
VGKFEDERVTIERIHFAIRKDKRKDRVELSPYQLSAALEKAESLNLSVVGWAHSHPRLLYSLSQTLDITVEPSHIDVRTQLNLQQLNSNFIGLILSCFDPSQTIKITAFQAIQFDNTVEKVTIPLVIRPVPVRGVRESVPVLIRLMVKEEREVFEAFEKRERGNTCAQGYHCMVYLLALQNIRMILLC